MAPSESVRVPVLMWHKVGAVAPSRYWVVANQFDRQIQAIHDTGHTPISLQQLYGFLAGEVPALPTKPVVLSFDDGYQDLYTHVFPVLQRYGYKAVAFLPTDKVGEEMRQDNSWDVPEAEYRAYHLLWSEVQEMSATGLVDFQSHTVTHANLEDPNVDAVWELEQSLRDIEVRLQHPVAFFSYPYGAGTDNPRVRALVRCAGYYGAVAAWGGTEDTRHTDIWALKRLEVASWHDVICHGDTERCFMHLLDPKLCSCVPQHSYHRRG